MRRWWGIIFAALLMPIMAQAQSPIPSLPTIGTNGSVYPLPDTALNPQWLWMTQQISGVSTDFKIDPFRLGAVFVSAVAPAVPFTYQLWWNTSVSPPQFEYYTGSKWSPVIPQTSSGFVTGPTSAVSGHGASFLGTSGTVIQDSGLVLGTGNFPGAIASIAIGNGIVLASATADHCLAIGTNALQNFTQGALGAPCGNTALGEEALLLDITGQENTAIGQFVLANSNASGNTAVGQGSMQNSTTGPNQVAVGWGSLFKNTTGGYNTGVGFGALFSVTSACCNTALGMDALGTSTGDHNVAIGYNAGTNLTTQIDTVIIGNCTGSPTTVAGVVYLCDGVGNPVFSADGVAAYFSSNQLLGFGSILPTTTNYALTGDGAAYTALNVPSPGAVRLRVNNTDDVIITGTAATSGTNVIGDLFLGATGGQIAPSAADPYIFISAGSGPPTSIPSFAALGRTALYDDTLDHELCWYEAAGTQWECITGGSVGGGGNPSNGNISNIPTRPMLTNTFVLQISGLPKRRDGAIIGQVQPLCIDTVSNQVFVGILGKCGA